MSNTDIKALDQQYIANTYGRFPLQLCSGKGALVQDETGKEYIDLGSGIAVNSFGYCDAEWAEAVSAQLATLQHTSNLYYTEPCVRLAEQLCLRTGMEKVFFSNSGAEANECAIKAARKYAADKYGAECHIIVTLENSFHGRTVTTLAATGQDHYHHDFLPLTEGFIHIPANDISAVEALKANPNIAAVMFEVVQGEGGVIALNADFVQALADYAAENDVLLVVDEVQTGNGRTGKLYGFMHYGITPDIVSTAKGLGGGLPLGATMFGKKTASVLTAGTHGSTFGGNPVCCAGALSIIRRLDDAFLADVTAKAEWLKNTFTGAPGIKGVSGMGLMMGLTTEKPATEVVAACREQGVLLLTAKDKVRLLPPLNISTEQLEQAAAVIKAVCAEA